VSTVVRIAGAGWVGPFPHLRIGHTRVGRGARHLWDSRIPPGIDRSPLW
jgi:hypothetical protein